MAKNAGGDGQSNTIILRAFIANAGIAIAKFVAAFITGSSAMMTEGIHSTVDTLNQVMMWIGEKRSKKSADRLHPLGYGPELYFWSFIVAMLIFTIGAGVSAYEGVHTLLHPEPTTSPLIAFIVLGVAFLLEGWSWKTAWKEFRRRRPRESVLEGIHNTKDTTSLVVLLEDSAAVTGIVLAASGIGLELLTGDPVWDGIASLGIAALLALVAIVLLREAKGLLIGESADPELIEALRGEVARSQGVTRVYDVLTLHLGPDNVVAVISADFDDEISVGRLEDIVLRIEKEVKDHHKSVSRVYLRPVKGDGKTSPGLSPERQRR